MPLSFFDFSEAFGRPAPLWAKLQVRFMQDTTACCVIFGASGDLTRRKLIPALYHLQKEGHLPGGMTTIGVARRAKSDDDFRSEVADAASKYSRTRSIEVEPWQRLARELSYVQGTFEDPETYRRLSEKIAPHHQTRLFYLAVGPSDMLGIVEQLAAAGLLRHDPLNGLRAHVIVEKPFGEDLASAHVLNRELFKYVSEEQLFRIDHYLGKETVQNLAVLRFENIIFEALWNRNHVSHVEITVAEDIGIEGRGKFYEKVGITRDVVQNHVLQLLTLVAMEPPSAFEANALRDEKVKVLRALRRIEGEAVAREVVRAQYVPGLVQGAHVLGYRAESDVAPGSLTETFVAMRVHIDNWRWAGVPFFLRAGKRMSRRLAEVVVHFRDPPYALFPHGAGRSPNFLALQLQPDEGITLRFDTKTPGNALRIQGADLEWSYGKAFGGGGPEAYERLFLDAIRGDATLFTRHDEVEAQWRFIDPIVKAYSDGALPLVHYASGTSGPAEAERLMADHGFTWRRSV
jgi:glucose-6-phosphate 1-dehydrogenase